MLGTTGRSLPTFQHMIGDVGMPNISPVILWVDPRIHNLTRSGYGVQTAKGPRFPPGRIVVILQLSLTQLQPLVAPHVSHFSHVPLRTIVKFWHSEHMLPV